MTTSQFVGLIKKDGVVEYRKSCVFRWTILDLALGLATLSMGCSGLFNFSTTTNPSN